MGKGLRRVLLTVWILAGILAGWQSIQKSRVPLDSLLGFCMDRDGKTIAGWYDGNDTIIARTDKGGVAEGTYRYRTVKGSRMYTVRGMASGENYTYVLRDRKNAYTGELLAQELVVLDFNSHFRKEKKVFELTPEENMTYGWLNATGDTITLISTDKNETKAVRSSYEFGAVLDDTLSLKNTRTYPLKTGEGVYKAMGNSTNLVYISDSGKVYFADEEQVYEVFPARTLETLMYPNFIAYAESGYVYLGEHESGDISRLNLSDGTQETLLSGSSPFGGSSVYTPRDIVSISMSGLNNFTALVKNGQDSSFHFLVCQDGSGTVLNSFRYGVAAFLWSALRQWLVYAGISLLAVLALGVLISGIRGGHTIMERLLSATIPLLAVTMVLFGYISFRYYGTAIDENYSKQVMDEGNMLAALFGQESLQEIEYPYDYSSEAYQYLSQQLATRELYTRVLYYESGAIYVGVDRNSPCFYPGEILMNLPAEELYRKAALTGESVMGTIEDQNGKRMVCITPVGGLSGETVYLLETGLYTANIAAYTATYIKDFVMVSVAFLLIVLVMLMVLFYRILAPIGEIKREMQLFADGDRSIRIRSTSEDELTGITQVFNKMADDINVQIVNLERMSEIYYHFVPPSMIGLLGQDNLASMTLGSSVKGSFAIMNVRMYPEESLPIDKKEALMNRFFNTVNRFAKQSDIITIVDDANLQSMLLICREGADAAAAAALTILARIDADNQLYDRDGQMNVMFVADQTEVYFGICGDEERYIPVVLAPEFEKLLEHGEFLRGMGSRFLMTESVSEKLQSRDQYAKRYIGRLRAEELDLGLYDMYDEKGAEEVRVMKQSQRAFDKAMELYEKGFYYEAKNLYARVLRENPGDMAAKYYIFRCEALQDREQ